MVIWWDFTTADYKWWFGGELPPGYVTLCYAKWTIYNRRPVVQFVAASQALIRQIFRLKGFASLILFALSMAIQKMRNMPGKWSFQVQKCQKGFCRGREESGKRSCWKSSPTSPSFETESSNSGSLSTLATLVQENLPFFPCPTIDTWHTRSLRPEVKAAQSRIFNEVLCSIGTPRHGFKMFLDPGVQQMGGRCIFWGAEHGHFVAVSWGFSVGFGNDITYLSEKVVGRLHHKTIKDG